jgi:hypothetical protein
MTQSLKNILYPFIPLMLITFSCKKKDETKNGPAVVTPKKSIKSVKMIRTSGIANDIDLISRSSYNYADGKLVTVHRIDSSKVSQGLWSITTFTTRYEYLNNKRVFETVTGTNTDYSVHHGVYNSKGRILYIPSGNDTIDFTHFGARSISTSRRYERVSYYTQGNIDSIITYQNGGVFSRSLCFYSNRRDLSLAYLDQFEDEGKVSKEKTHTEYYQGSAFPQVLEYIYSYYPDGYPSKITEEFLGAPFDLVYTYYYAYN